jgi:hypothetical protein
MAELDDDGSLLCRDRQHNKRCDDSKQPGHDGMTHLAFPPVWLLFAQPACSLRSARQV